MPSKLMQARTQQVLETLREIDERFGKVRGTLKLLLKCVNNLNAEDVLTVGKLYWGVENKNDKFTIPMYFIEEGDGGFVGLVAARKRFVEVTNSMDGTPDNIYTLVYNWFEGDSYPVETIEQVSFDADLLYKVALRIALATAVTYPTVKIQCFRHGEMVPQDMRDGGYGSPCYYTVSSMKITKGE